MITVDGGFVKLVNQKTEIKNNELESVIFARMYYANAVAKQQLDLILFQMGFLENIGKTNDDDVRVKTIWINPFDKEHVK